MLQVYCSSFRWQNQTVLGAASYPETLLTTNTYSIILDALQRDKQRDAIFSVFRTMRLHPFRAQTRITLSIVSGVCEANVWNRPSEPCKEPIKRWQSKNFKLIGKLERFVPEISR